MNTDISSQQFSLNYLLCLIAGIATSLAFTVAPLLQGNGWLHGYASLILFFIGILIACWVGASLLKRLMPILVWPIMMAAFLAIAICASLIWYIETSIPTFSSIGFEPHEEIAFKKIGWDDGFFTIKYAISDPPNCEIVSYLSTTRNGFVGKITN